MTTDPDSLTAAATDRADLTARLGRTLPGVAITAQRPNLTPELDLWLIDADFPRGPLPPGTARAVLADPAYWAFCWASGQALARVILDHPGRVRGRRVVDLGCGSGVVAIAAARAGAAEVIACDIDADARAATLANARRNRVTVTPAADFAAIDGRLDLILIADLFYDAANLALARAVVGRADAVVVADSRLRELPVQGFMPIAVIESATVPDLDESAAFRRVRLYATDTRQWPASNHNQSTS